MTRMISKTSSKRPGKRTLTVQGGGIRAIASAGAVLRALQMSGKSLSLGELSKILHIPRSTVQRVVDALDREGLVIAASATSGVRLGPALLALAKATQFEIADLIRPTLTEMALSTHETVDLAVMGHDKLVFIEQLEGKQHLRVVSGSSVVVPLHCSASGKAMLAALSAPELEKFRKTLKLTAMTKHTLTSWKQLDRELDDIRKTGVAIDRNEFNLGSSAVATAFRGPARELAAVAMLIPTQRFEEDEESFQEILLTCMRKAPVALAFDTQEATPASS